MKNVFLVSVVVLNSPFVSLVSGQDPKNDMVQVKPVLDVPFGTRVTGKIVGYLIVDDSLVVDASGELSVIISDIDRHNGRINISARDIVVYDSGGIQHQPDALMQMRGKRVSFFEGGGFVGFPNGFWNGRSPVSTNRQFGFYSSFTFLIAKQPVGTPPAAGRR